MLGHATTENLNNDIRNISSNIASIEQQLAILREEKKRKENELQAIQTLVAAGNSAIEQAENFLTLATRARRDDLIESFWEEMDALRDRQPIAELPEASEPDPVEEDPIEPQPEPNGGGDAIAVDDNDASDSENESSPEVVELRQPQSVGAAVIHFNEMTITELRSECDSRGISRDTVRTYGKLTLKNTWVAALEDAK